MGSLRTMTDDDERPDPSDEWKSGFNSDEDGELYFWSDDPESATWTVTAVYDDRSEVLERETGVGFPALGYRRPYSAWILDRSYRNLSIDKADART